MKKTKKKKQSIKREEKPGWKKESSRFSFDK